MKYQKFEFTSFRLLTIQTDQFKNCHMEINFLDDLKRVDTPIRSLLVKLMAYTTLDYPTKREVLIALEELYNSGYTSDSVRLGQNFLSSFAFDFIDPKFVKSKSYLEDCIHFFTNAILNPHVKDGKFDTRSFDILKERVLSSLDDYKENAFSFARHESFKALFKDTIIENPIIGTKEEIEKITPSDIFEEYNKMFANSKVDILVIGNLNMEQVASYFQKYFQKTSIVSFNLPFYNEFPLKPLKEIEQQGDYAQTILLFYLQFQKLSDFERHAVVPLYNIILGRANMTDKLTKLLRIEHSLCYTSSSVVNLGNSYLRIQTGLKYENVLEAKKLINQALEEMKHGQIDADYFNIQKAKLIESLQMQEDNEYYLLDNYYFHEIFNEPLHEERRKEYQKVTINDIKKLASKLTLTMIYTLKEVSNFENN